MQENRLRKFLLIVRQGVRRFGFDRAFLIVLGVAVTVLFIVGMGKDLTGQDGGETRVTFFQIGTGSTGGTYFPMGEALAAIISQPPGAEPCLPGGHCGVPGVVAIAKGSPGSVANVRAVASGRLDSALVQANVLAAAYDGTGEFEGEGPRANLRVIANLYVEAIHLVIARGIDVRSVSDLKGLRVSIGPDGSGTRPDAIAILEAFGVTLADIEPVEADASRSAEMILTGMLDAYFLVAGAPARSIDDLARRGAIDLIPVVGTPADRLLLEREFYSRLSIPEGTYRHIDTVETLGVGALWITRASSSDRLVYQITRSLFDERNRATLVSAHANGESVTLATAVRGVPILLHPGAERFYFEAGILTR